MTTRTRKPRLTQRARDLQALASRLRTQRMELATQSDLLRAKIEAIDQIIDEVELRLNTLKQEVLK